MNRKILIFILILVFSVPVWAQEDSGWQQILTDTAPPARYDHVLVFTGQTLVVFGGRSNSGTLGDTWVYDLEMGAWHEVDGSVAPPARHSMAASYDPNRERVVIFGGQSSGLYNDVWAFDVETETWSQLQTSGTLPAQRYGTSAVVDSETDTLLISHGFASGRFDDTFALDLETNTWTDISPVQRPLKRCLHDAAYDAASGLMILFGGCSSGAGPCPQGDTWAFDPLAQNWRELSAGPSPRSNPSLSADDAGVIWLFGGRASDGASAELWSLDIEADLWTQHRVENGPSPRSSHDAAWDLDGGRLFVFGGRASDGASAELWVYTP